MELKIGREKYELTEDDEILFNGACYILMTRKIGRGFREYSPTIAKTTMHKLIKNGDMVFKRWYETYLTSENMEVYKISEKKEV
jgi:hypothetical protein